MGDRVDGSAYKGVIITAFGLPVVPIVNCRLQTLCELKDRSPVSNTFIADSRALMEMVSTVGKA
jgi:hypothetical protein